MKGLTLILIALSMHGADNPLLTPSTLPYEFPPFDKIRDEHYKPAIEEGMRRQLAEVHAIAADAETPTFENTIVRLERSGQLLDRAAGAFVRMTSAHTNPTLEALQRELSPRLAEHDDAILLNGPLFARIRTLYESRGNAGLNAESKYLLERYYRDFVRAGAQLSAEDKTKLSAINKELASLGATFRENVLKESNAAAVFVEDRAELEGMPENEVAAAAAAAKKQGRSGYLIPLQNTTGQPPLSTLKNRALRQRILEASLARNSKGGQFDNRDVVTRAARLRAERAMLLGFPNFAAWRLADQTAETPAAVNRMLADIAPKAVANARREAADLQAMIDAEGGGFKLAAWDWDYYSEKVRKSRYEFDESQLRPYLELDRVLRDGVFHAAGKLYGLTFRERHDLPVYLPEVRVFEVFDRDSKPLALFVADYYARPSKRGGAWASPYVAQSRLFGQKPVIANHLNIPKPPEGEPTLLTWDEVKTLFHEFGHALHGIFSDITYPRLQTVPRDFGEYPSQVNEMSRDWPEVLRNYAKHYKTGEAMPAELLRRVMAAEKFNQGYMTTEYLAASLLDQAWHQLTPQQVPADALKFEAEALRKAGVDLPFVPPRYRSSYFSHIFGGGYAAAYYAYIWSEVLDADTVEWFRENGGLRRENGDHFRKTLLSRRGSEDAMDLYRTFRGRAPEVGPLLKRRGLE